MLSILTSDQYFKNYTYLQFSLFPNLFDLYIKKLNIQQLKVQLLSYVNTFLDFFQQSSMYERFSQPTIAHQIMLKYNCDGKNEIQQNISSITSKIASYLKQVQINMNQIQNLKNVLEQLNLIEAKNKMLQSIKTDIFKKHLTKDVFKIICKIVEEIIKKNGQMILYDWKIPFYLYESVIQNLINQKMLLLGKYLNSGQIKQGQKVAIVTLTCQIIKLKTIPYQIQLNNFHEQIVNCKGKQFYLLKMLNGQSNFEWYWKIMGLVNKINIQMSNIRPISVQNKKQQYFNSASQKIINQKDQNNLKTFSQVLRRVIQSIKSQMNISQGFINELFEDSTLNSIEKKLNQNSKKKQTIKQLNSENLQKISKYLNRLSLDTNQSQKYLRNNKLNDKSLNYSYKLKDRTELSDNKQQYDQFRHLNDQIELQFLQQKFMLNYIKLRKLIDQLKLKDVQIKGFQDKNYGSFLSQSFDFQQLTKSIRQLTKLNNKSLKQLLNFNLINFNSNNQRQQNKPNKNFQRNRNNNSFYFMLKQQVEKTSLQSNCILLALDELIELIQQCQFKLSQQQLKYYQKLYKCKNSIYINLLTIRLIKNSFGFNDKIQEEENYLNGQDEKDQPRYIDSIKDIQMIFQQTFYCSKYVNPQKLSANKLNQTLSYPSLQSILYFLSSTMLWTNLKFDKNIQIYNQNIGELVQLSQFFQLVIGKFSSQGVQIDKKQTIYVSYIIKLSQILKDFIYQPRSRDNQIQFFSISKITTKLNKLLQMQSQYQNSLNFFELINFSFIVQRFLDVILLQFNKFLYQLTDKKTSQNDSNKQKNQNKIAQQNILNQEISDNELLNQNHYKIDFKRTFYLNLHNNSKKIKSMSTFLFQKILKENFKSKINQANIISNNTYKVTDNQLSFLLINEWEIDKTFQLYQVFVALVQKSQKLNLCAFNKMQLQKSNKSTQFETNSFKSSYKTFFSNPYSLVLSVYKQIIGSYIEFIQLNDDICELSKNQAKQLSPFLKQRIQQLNYKLQGSIKEFIQRTLYQLIDKKQQIYKPSTQQIKLEIIHRQQIVTQQNKQQTLQKYKNIQNYFQNNIKICVLNLSFLYWMKSQLLVKFNILTEIQQVKYNNRVLNNKLNNQTSLSLFRFLTLLNLISPTQFIPDYNYLQAKLQSKLQKPIANQASLQENSTLKQLLQNYLYPEIQVRNSQLQREFMYIVNNQYLQFVYEYFPIKINCYKNQKYILNKAMQFTLEQSNHQFIGIQKWHKICYVKLSQYMNLLYKQSKKNSKNEIIL